MKLAEAFAVARQHQAAGKIQKLTFKIVSLQDIPRSGSNSDFFTTVSYQSGTASTLTYSPQHQTAQAMSGASFEGQFESILSDELTSPPSSGPNQIPPSGNPFNIRKASPAKMKVSAPVIANQPFLFTLHNIALNQSFRLDLHEIGDLWFGLGAPAGNPTMNVGWMISFGKVFSPEEIH